MKCNGHHHQNCNCGFGGVHHPNSISHAGAEPWSPVDYSYNTTCPKCGASVLFVRHNGGSVWFDAPGVLWPKHPCMAQEPGTEWLTRRMKMPIESGNRLVFGLVLDAVETEPGAGAIFRIECSDGTIIREEFRYTLLASQALGGLVVLELTKENKVEQRWFKMMDEVVDDHAAKLKAEERKGKMREGRLEAEGARKRAHDKVWEETKRRFPRLFRR